MLLSETVNLTLCVSEARVISMVAHGEHGVGTRQRQGTGMSDNEVGLRVPLKSFDKTEVTQATVFECKLCLEKVGLLNIYQIQ